MDPAVDGRFSVKSGWRVIRHPNPKVPWSVVVRFQGHVPRWVVIEWLCYWGRLASKDRLKVWGIVDDSVCCAMTGLSPMSTSSLIALFLD